MINQSANSSPLLDEAVEQLAKLPGIGRKTALRLALHILRQPVEYAEQFADAISRLRKETGYCQRCHNISDTETCAICSDDSREQNVVCVVENVKDVIAIEATGQFRGLYHVLGGLISPIDGISPDDLEISSLVQRVDAEHIQEVILALSPTLEGDTTSYYIFRRLASTGVDVSVLARGLAIGNDLEYTDPLTLGRSILSRMPYNENDT